MGVHGIVRLVINNIAACRGNVSEWQNQTKRHMTIGLSALPGIHMQQNMGVFDSWPWFHTQTWI